MTVFDIRMSSSKDNILKVADLLRTVIEANECRPFRLLDLPQELQDHVYRMYFGRFDLCVVYPRLFQSTIKALLPNSRTNLALASKKVRDDCYRVRAECFSGDIYFVGCSYLDFGCVTTLLEEGDAAWLAKKATRFVLIDAMTTKMHEKLHTSLLSYPKLREVRFIGHEEHDCYRHGPPLEGIKLVDLVNELLKPQNEKIAFDEDGYISKIITHYRLDELLRIFENAGRQCTLFFTRVEDNEWHEIPVTGLLGRCAERRVNILQEFVSDASKCAHDL